MDKNRVVWHEGLFLRPQHLQQQDRFLQHWIEYRCGGIRPYAWGITLLELDDALLGLGKLAIRRCQGIFPDGTPFDIPNTSPAPAPLDIPDAMKNTGIGLALALRQADTLEISSEADEKTLTRYKIKDLNIKDLHTEEIDSQAELQVGTLNLHLLPETEKQNAFAVIPLSRIIERKKDGTIHLDKAFIPTVLHCQANNTLSSFITEIEALLKHRGEALATRLVEANTGGIAEISDFLLLQLVNRFESILKHIKTVQMYHPVDFYQLAIELAGELATFTQTQRRPIALEAYQHTDLQASFKPVMDEIRRALSMVLEQRAIAIELKLHKYGIWVGLFKDKSLLDSAGFVLAAKANVSSEKIRSKFPKQTTIATVETIRNLVNSHLPGVKISPLAVAPRQIPYHSGFTYFEVHSQNKYWQALKTSGGLAIHIGANFSDLELELWAIRN
jgi:type VI secretion system protein ImpJ